jgi:hypothetical protein
LRGSVAELAAETRCPATPSLGSFLDFSNHHCMSLHRRFMLSSPRGTSDIPSCDDLKRIIFAERTAHTHVRASVVCLTTADQHDLRLRLYGAWALPVLIMEIEGFENTLRILAGRQSFARGCVTVETTVPIGCGDKTKATSHSISRGML